jgi:hypothetical protein
MRFTFAYYGQGYHFYCISNIQKADELFTSSGSEESDEAFEKITWPGRALFGMKHSTCAGYFLTLVE